MSYEIKTRKGHRGWVAESTAELGETPEGMRMLELFTSKCRGGLVATAHVYVLKDQGNGFVTKTTTIFQDYNKQAIAPTPCKRVTEKALINAHQSALLEMDDIVEEAKAFYAAPTPENA